MRVIELPVDAVFEPEWNPNEMDAGMRSRLRRSIDRFGFLVPLVVRPIGKGRYETIGGAQRLSALKESGVSGVPCVVVESDDAEARLLSQVLNHVEGEDNPGLRAELVRGLLDEMPEEEVLDLLPDSADSLRALASLGTQYVAGHLTAWQKARSARLRRLQFQLTEPQLEIVQKALTHAVGGVTNDEGSPNRRGTALTAICRAYIQSKEDKK